MLMTVHKLTVEALILIESQWNLNINLSVYNSRIG